MKKINTDLTYKKYVERTVTKKYLNQQFKILSLHKNVAKKNLDLFNKTVKENKLLKSDLEYLRFFYEMLHKIDFNLAELARGIRKLATPKDLMNSMFLFRGLMELVFFNIYLSQKLNTFLNKKRYEDFIDICCRANLASGSDSIKLDMITSESFILSKIIKKFKNKRIHINDCIRFYKKTDFAHLALSNPSLKNIIGELKGGKKFFYSRDLKIDTEIIISAYDRLCEVIHPTALMINDTQDEKTLVDYKEIILKICTSFFFLFNVTCFDLKTRIFSRIIDNRATIINTFKKVLK